MKIEHHLQRGTELSLLAVHSRLGTRNTLEHTNPQQCCCEHVLRAEISMGDQKRELCQQYGPTIAAMSDSRMHSLIITHPMCVGANDEAQLGVPAVLQ